VRERGRPSGRRMAFAVCPRAGDAVSTALLGRIEPIRAAWPRVATLKVAGCRWQDASVAPMQIGQAKDGMTAMTLDGPGWPRRDRILGIFDVFGV